LEERASVLHHGNYHIWKCNLTKKKLLISAVLALSATYLLQKFWATEMLLIRNDQGIDLPNHTEVSLKQSLKSIKLSIAIVSARHGFYCSEDCLQNCTVCRKKSIGFLKDPDEAVPDYKGLEITFRNRSARYIALNDRNLYEDEREEFLEDIDFGFISDQYEHNEDFLGKRQCYRNNWGSKLYPVCNDFHETTLDRAPSVSQEYDIRYLGHGYYRHAWIYGRNDTRGSESFVLKSLRSKFRLKFDQESMMQVQKEAIVMDSLTASPRIVDIYGLCGTSVLVEAMESTATPHVIPNEKHTNQSKLEIIQDRANDVVPMNNLTVLQRLNWATMMAESIADLHGYKGGIIAHGDIHTDQWLVSFNGMLKLNDFNFAEILNYNPESSEYCRSYRNGFDRKFASPEELRSVRGNEGIDTYSMGHSIYGLLTGLPPFYQYPNLQYDVTNDIKSRRKQVRPHVDARYRNRSMIEGKLVNIMERCWEWNFEKRISIFEVVKMLRDVKFDVPRN